MKNKSLLLALAAAVVLGACGNQEAKTTAEVKTEESQTVESNDSNDAVKEVATDDESGAKDPIPATEKTLEEAIDAFYAHYGDETIELTSAEYDEDDGKYVYNVDRKSVV